jgi:hypothetical protein
VFSTIFALVTLVVFILPGFVTLRLASGRRATPAKLGDLELVLRALGYSLLLHIAFALTGWTAWLVRKVDHKDAWMDHMDDLALFAVAASATAAVLGALLNVIFDGLQNNVATSRRAQWLFQFLGGEDVRDGFDYIFARRKDSGKDFIVQVRTDGEDGEQVHVGRYGTRSYMGVSPRPHDLYLEEMWEPTEEGPRKPEAPEGAWFAADSIKDLRFRDLPEEDKQAGTTRRLGIIGVDEALRQERERLAAEIADAVPHLARDPDDLAQISEDFGHALDRTAEAVRDAPGSDEDTGEIYSYWTGKARHEMLELAALGSALAAAQQAHSDRIEPFRLGTREIASAIAAGQHRLRVPTEPRDIWIRVLRDQGAKLSGSRWAYGEFTGLLARAIFEIDNAEWD